MIIHKLFLKRRSLLALVALIAMLPSCGQKSQQVNVTVTSEAADGLDLKAVTALLKTVKDPADLEKRINSGSPRICNLDLNEDGTIDYVKVTEYASGNTKGFSLTTELGENNVQELATIEIMQDASGKHRVQTHGNSQIYGANHYHHHHGPGIGDYLLMHYMFSSHRPYRSSYGYNRYPSHYSRAAPVDRSSYRSSMSKISSSEVRSSSKPSFKDSYASPNKTRSSNKIKAPLRQPTTSQKSFQKRNPSRSVRSGGFGSRSKSSSKSIRSSSRTRSSFGRGK